MSAVRVRAIEAEVAAVVVRTQGSLVNVRVIHLLEQRVGKLASFASRTVGRTGPRATRLHIEARLFRVRYLAWLSVDGFEKHYAASL